MGAPLRVLIFLAGFAGWPVGHAFADQVTAVASAVEEGAKTAGKALDIYIQGHAEAQAQLAQDKKDALATALTDLMDLSALKRSMAKQLRCLGNEEAGRTASNSKFYQCWDAFNSQNERFRQYLNDLMTHMAIADPNWNVAHPDERKALDALYWEKAALAADALQFVRNSKTGFLVVNVSVNPTDANTLATALESEATKLDEAATKLADLLMQPSLPTSH
jgi:hypothetical protein